MSTRAKKNLYKEKSMNGPKNQKKTSRSRSARQKIDAGSYRIIGGQWRSRRVNFPVIEGLRPTTDRVRETLFNWLSFFVDGASVLDVFSGSGALGFEALSRGASSLVAIEKNAQAAEALKQNLALLQGAPESSSHTYVQHTDALLYLAEIKHESDKSLSRTAEQERARFDLIFKRKEKRYNNDLFLLILFIVNLIYFGFFVNHFEDRYLSHLFPFVFLVVGKASLSAYDYLKKYNKLSFKNKFIINSCSN